jgi:drug/metabolite transporter (DMT)-like permease
MSGTPSSPPPDPESTTSARARFGALSPVVQSAIIATIAMVLFSVVPPSVRLLSDTMSSWQIVFIRAFFGVVGIGAYLTWSGLYELKSRQVGIHFIRSTFNFVGMVMWFWALGLVELAKGIAIHFTMPLFITLFAMVFLRERVGPRRLGAMLVGFAGVLIILRPGMIETGLPELAILGSAALYGGAVIFLKIVVREETPLAVTFYTNLFMALWCLVPTWMYWAPLTADDILPVLGLGVCGLFAPFMVAVALKHADASLIAAFDFLRLPFTAAFGFALFGEVPDEFVWAGAAVIFVSTYYIARRETKRAREGARDNPATPQNPAK